MHFIEETKVNIDNIESDPEAFKAYYCYATSLGNLEIIAPHKVVCC